MKKKGKKNNHQTTILVKFSIFKNVTETNNFLLASILILIRKIYHKNKSEIVGISPIYIHAKSNSRPSQTMSCQGHAKISYLIRTKVNPLFNARVNLLFHAKDMICFQGSVEGE